jgi:hypothetical protein
MKKIFLVCTSLIALTLNAQEEKPAVRISEVQLLTLADYSKTPFGTLQDMQKIAPQSILLQQDFSGYNLGSYSSIFTQNSFNMMLGLSFRDKPGMTLRAGVGYSDRTLQGVSLGNNERFRHDTLTSSQTGQQFFVDSAVYRGVYAYYNSQFLSLETSLIFRTNSEARWSLYGGVGLSFGIGFNGRTDVTRHEYWSIESPISTNYGNVLYESESISSRNSFFYSVNTPLGVDFRIGKKREFWNRLHLMYELRPAITVYNLAGEQNRLTPQLNQSLGLRVTF